MMLFAYANTSLQCLCHLFAIHEIECYCGYTKMIAATLWGSALPQWKPGEGPERSVIRAKRDGCLFLHHNRATLEFHKGDISDASARHEHAHLHAVFVAVQETKHADFPVNRLHHCTSMTYFRCQWYFSKYDWQADKWVTWLTHADHKAVVLWILAETHAVTPIPEDRPAIWNGWSVSYLEVMSLLLIFPKYTWYFQCWQGKKTCSVSEFSGTACHPCQRYAAVNINMFTHNPICMQEEKRSLNENFISIIIIFMLASDT